MTDPDYIEMAGDCPRCHRPCEGYRIIPPDFLLAGICKHCETMVLIINGYATAVLAFDGWAAVQAKLAKMAHGEEVPH